MAVKDPAAVAAKWVRNTQASSQSVTDGVNAVTVSPMEKAVANVDGWMAKLQASRDKWVRNTRAVSLEQWRQAMLSKGISRMQTGVTEAQGKFAAVMSQLLPYLEQGAATVRAMPNLTIEDGIARAAAQIRHNAAFQKRAVTF